MWGQHAACLDQQQSVAISWRLELTLLELNLEFLPSLFLVLSGFLSGEMAALCIFLPKLKI